MKIPIQVFLMLDPWSRKVHIIKNKFLSLKVLSKGTGGGVWVLSIDRPLNTLHFHRFKKYLKDPGS
jgi:hypothetical protein